MTSMKRTRPSWKRSPNTRPEVNFQPPLDGSTAWADLSVLREAIEDLPCAYDSTVEEVLHLRTENRSLRGALEAAKAKLIRGLFRLEPWESVTEWLRWFTGALSRRGNYGGLLPPTRRGAMAAIGRNYRWGNR